jgi:hypothetical protein
MRKAKASSAQSTTAKSKIVGGGEKNELPR